MVLEALFVRHLRLVLLPVDVLLANDQLFVVLPDLLLKLRILPIQFLLLHLTRALRHAVHSRVGLLGLTHLLAQVALVGLQRFALLLLEPGDHHLHLVLVVDLCLLLFGHD
mmetsp:Transcript_28598/g.38131  ORF Transcript_28598/g.38131 Transcript_28598/m.38131 type:complete len:111 (+) Transcript_28598:942-1274(+)